MWALEDLATTGACTKGDLPDRSGYDIHCELMGGPDYKLNYLLLGCDERQRASGCSVVKCRHHAGGVEVKAPLSVKRKLADLDVAAHKRTSSDPDVSAGETAQIKEDAVAKKSLKKCFECGELRTIIGRGLCGRDYHRLQKAGVLDDKYPVKPKHSNKKSGRPSAVDQNTEQGLSLVKEPTNVVPACDDSQFPPVRVLLCFEARDQKLGDYLSTWATVERRTVEAQLMVIIDKAVDERRCENPL